MVRYVEMGTCNGASGQFESCALVPDECGPNQSFDPVVQDLSTIKNCDPNDVSIGRCLQENACAMRETDCEFDQNPENFNADDETCTHQRDKSLPWDVNNPSFTQFGSCKDNATGEHFCIYHPEDCDDSGTEEYQTPAQTLAAGITCDCSKVHVLACNMVTGHLFCGIQEDSFTNIYRQCAYASPHEQRTNRDSGSSNVDCRLCKMRNTVPPTPAPTYQDPPTPNPTLRPTNSPTKFVPKPTGSPNNTEDLIDKAKIAEAGIIGGLIGALIVLTIGFIVWLTMYWKRIKEGLTEEDSVNKPPPMGQISMMESRSGEGLHDTFEVNSAISDEDHIMGFHEIDIKRSIP